MNRKLEDLFNLDNSNLPEAPVLETQVEQKETYTEALDNLEKIENALPQVRGLETSDIELDELANMATASYKDLMDLGMQVDSRFSSEIFGVAGNLLGHAITAKTAKINKKLKTIELQLKKATLDQKAAAKNEEIDSTPIGQGQKLDRNELLAVLNAKNKE
jgi:hypothetical protein